MLQKNMLKNEDFFFFNFPCIITQAFPFCPNISLFLSLSIPLLEGQRGNTSVDHFVSLEV